MSRCVCCDLPVESCGREIEKERRRTDANERSRVLKEPGAIPAKYNGRCNGCGEWFPKGTPIRADSNEDGKWIAQCCLVPLSVAP